MNDQNATVQEHPAPQSSVELETTAKGTVKVTVKSYSVSIDDAAAEAMRIYDLVVARYAAPAPTAADDGCAEGPAACGYNDYLGRRRSGETSDMPHAGYHAACAASTQHMATCKEWGRVGDCQTCRDHETRLRA